MAGQTLRETREEFLRARIDPVDVFDDDNEWRRLARAENHVAKHPEGPLLELRTDQPIEKLLGRRDAEEMGEQDGLLVSLQVQELKLLGNAAPDFLGGAPIGETEVSPQELDDRTVRHSAAIGDAGRLQLEDSGCVEPLQELVEQA